MATSNAPDALSVSERYQGAQGDQYYRSHFSPDQEFGRKLQSEYFLPYCRRDLTLLDFGCGDGTILRCLPASQHLGIEVNPHCRERINENNQILAPRLEVYPDIGLIADESIDVAISNHALEHTLQPAETLVHLRRVLKPGGTFVLVTPFDDWRPRKYRQWRPADKDNHLYTWTPMNIGNLLNEVGFQVQESRVVSRARSPKLYWVKRRFGDRMFDEACRVFSWVKNRREVFTLARKP